MMLRDWRETCGIIGVYNHPESANLVYLGLYALQHRGQESAGIASNDGHCLISRRGLGLVADVFKEETIRQLNGRYAIGHNRYSTAGETLLKNTQPLVVDYSQGGLAIAHNGNLINAASLRQQLEDNGSIFQSSVDTEVIIHLIANARGKHLIDRTVSALQQVSGAYSLLFLSEQEMIAARDPNGFRPLVLGSLGEATIIASETCAIDLIGATYEREIEPGEILLLNNQGRQSIRPFSRVPRTNCVFEYIYFARPDSLVYGRNVYEVRKKLGRQLAREQPAKADVVIPVPDSGVPATLGYAQESGQPFEFGLIRNHYVNRTFIEPEQSIRDFGTKIKLNAQPEVLQGKRVVVVDDSIVRGTTCRKLIRMIRSAGAAEVHFRVSSPPIVGPCFYGVDTPERSQLVASEHTIEEVRDSIGADSLGYLSIEGLYSSVGANMKGDDFCAACFTKSYAIPIPKSIVRNYRRIVDDAKQEI